MQDHFTKFATALDRIPIAKEALKEMGEDQFNKLFSEYMLLLEQLSSFTDEDLEFVKRVYSNFDKWTVPGGGVEEGTDQFIHRIGRESLNVVSQAVVDVSKTESSVYKDALEELSLKMYNGYKLSQKGKKFVNSDPESDKVIWTHTMVTDLYSIMHVILSHFTERYIYKYLESRNIDVNLPKDYLLNILDDLIILQELNNPGGSVIFNAWFKPKEDGGLSWINPDKVRAYRDLYKG